MKRVIQSEPELHDIQKRWGIETPPARQTNRGTPDPPIIYSAAELLDLAIPVPAMLFEGLPLPTRGTSLIVGAAKSGKTILAVQEAIAVASGRSLFDAYRVLEPGPVLIVEQDDPAGAASIKTILQCAGVARSLPLHMVPKVPFGFGPALLEWIEKQVSLLSLRLVLLDSYTALRTSRPPGIDIVKAEQTRPRRARRAGEALRFRAPGYSPFVERICLAGLERKGRRDVRDVGGDRSADSRIPLCRLRRRRS